MIRELVAAFVKVNIDDDLYVQAEDEKKANSSALDFDEFEEALARRQVFERATVV